MNAPETSGPAHACLDGSGGCMRICLFTPTFLPTIGGAERSADMIAQGLQARGHEVRVLAQRPRRMKAQPPLPYPVHHFRRPPSPHLWPEALALPLWRLHRRWPFDVCLAFYSYPTGYAASTVKDRLGFRLLCSPRGADLYTDNHNLGKPRVRSTIRRGYRHSDRIVTISEWMVGRLHKIVGEPLPPIDMVYNGIDIEEVDASRRRVRADPPRVPVREPFILHMARLAKTKNQQLAIEAVARLQGCFRARDLRYVIAGEGNCEARLKALIQHHGIGDIVTMIGPRTGEDKTWLMDRAELFVTTSREEAFGHVVLEAMAHGLPILASDTSAHRELLSEQDWGLRFESDNVADMAARLSQMMTADLSDMRRRAREKVAAFDLRFMIDGYERSCRRTMDSLVGSAH